MKNSAEKTVTRLSWFIDVQRLRYKIYKIALWQTLVTKGEKKTLHQTLPKRGRLSRVGKKTCYTPELKEQPRYKYFSLTTEKRLSDSNSEKKGLEHWEKLARKLT